MDTNTSLPLTEEAEELPYVGDLSIRCMQARARRLVVLSLGDPVGETSRYELITTAPHESISAPEPLLQFAPREDLPWWCGYAVVIEYDARGLFEPAAPQAPRSHLRMIPIHECCVLDHAQRRAHFVPDRTAATNGMGDFRTFINERICAPVSVDAVDFVDRLDSAAMADTLSGMGELTRAEYTSAVGKLKEHIACGDLYECNFTQRFRLKLRLPPLTAAAALFKLNPAPHRAFIDLEDTVIISCSPELFLRRNGGEIITRPIKGTVRRSDDALQDEALRADLRYDPKQRAEHTMVIDVSRNDLGRVCEFGTVEVPDPFAIQSFPAVHHMVSEVSGQLRGNASVGDILRATFPAASITGAPKIKAMEMIAQYEASERGIYTGAIGHIAANGDLDLNVAIRTVVAQRCGEEWEYSFGSGGAIVADSDPQAEYEECLLKAQRIYDILTKAARFAGD